MRSSGGSDRFSKLKGSKADNRMAQRPEEEGQPEMPAWWLSTGWEADLSLGWRHLKNNSDRESSWAYVPSLSD